MLYKVQKIPFDPEGLFTTLTALATFLLGALCFRLSDSAKGRWSQIRLSMILVSAGFIMLAVEPINKNLWTVPYTLFTAAAGIVLLQLLKFIRPATFVSRLASPLEVMGKNPLLIYVLSSLAGKTLALWKLPAGISVKQAIFQQLTVLPFSPAFLSLLYSILLLMVFSTLAHFMRRYALDIR